MFNVRRYCCTVFLRIGFFLLSYEQCMRIVVHIFVSIWFCYFNVRHFSGIYLFVFCLILLCLITSLLPSTFVTLNFNICFVNASILWDSWKQNEYIAPLCEIWSGLYGILPKYSCVIKGPSYTWYGFSSLVMYLNLNVFLSL
jgi:hypothetical protein